MKVLVLVLAIVVSALALPNNFYHQEYNYKTSSSSYRNNELQHKKDDEGFMSKDGDLEGRVAPLVNSHSQHSEYVNPKLQHNSRYGMDLGTSDVSSYGQLTANNHLARANLDGLYGNYGYGNTYGQNFVDGVASTDHIASARQAFSATKNGYNSYGMSDHQTYGITSNLRTLSDRVREDFSRQLQDSLYQHNGNLDQLERELRNNLTRSYQDALQSQYGTQSVRGGLSYTISGGRVQPTANYDNQELMDLKRQTENVLLNQLRQQYRSSSSGSTYYQNQNYGTSSTARSYYGTPSTSRPYYNTYYSPTTSTMSYEYYPSSSTTSRPYYNTYYSPSTSTMSYEYYPSSSSTSRPYSSTITSYAEPYSSSRYSPASNPDSIHTIAIRVQDNLNRRLNDVLRNVQNQYFSSQTNSQYSTSHYDDLLGRLQQELRSNITYHLDDEIRRQYGNQIARDNHYYSVGSNGQYNTQSNYSERDLEALKQQIQNNLLEKLNRDFQTYRSRYSQNSSSYQYSGGASSLMNSGVKGGHYYNGRGEYEDTRPSASYMVPLITSGTKQHNSYSSGSTYGGYAAMSASSSNIADLQRQLQQQLSNQLRAAINQNRYSGNRYSSDSSYQTSYNQLNDELSRNLTRQLEGLMSNYGSSSSSSYSNQQLNDLRNQLQDNLQRELQQGLRQSYSTSSSFSASSSSSSHGNYRPVRQYPVNSFGAPPAGALQPDCTGEHAVFRRSIGSLPHVPYDDTQQVEEIHAPHHLYRDYFTHQAEDHVPNRISGYHSAPFSYYHHLPTDVSEEEPSYNLGSVNGHHGRQHPILTSSYHSGRRIDDGGIMQAPLDRSSEVHFVGQHPVVQEEQLDTFSHGFHGLKYDDGGLVLPSVESEDSTTKASEELNSHHSPQTQYFDQNPVGQEVEDDDLTQKVVQEEQLDTSSHGYYGMKIDDGGLVAPLVESTESTPKASEELNSHHSPQTQYFDQNPVGQEVEDEDLTQKVEGVQISLHHSPQAQYLDEIPVGQEVENDDFGVSHHSPQAQQHLDQNPVEQEEETVTLHHSPQMSFGQELENEDLTQQTEDLGFNSPKPHQQQEEQDDAFKQKPLVHYQSGQPLYVRPNQFEAGNSADLSHRVDDEVSSSSSHHSNEKPTSTLSSTRLEAEQEADSLIDALRRSQQNLRHQSTDNSYRSHYNTNLNGGGQTYHSYQPWRPSPGHHPHFNNHFPQHGQSTFAQQNQEEEASSIHHSSMHQPYSQHVNPMVDDLSQQQESAFKPSTYRHHPYHFNNEESSTTTNPQKVESVRPIDDGLILSKPKPISLPALENAGLHYSQQNHIEDNQETAQVREVEPVVAQEVHLDELSELPQYSIDIRASSNGETVVPEWEGSTTTNPTTTAASSWWKQFGNKVVNGVKSLKEKIVG